MAERRVLTVSEVATRLRVHPITVYRLIKSSRLPAFRIGRVWRFDSDEFEEWMRTAKRPMLSTNGRRHDAAQYFLTRRRKPGASKTPRRFKAGMRLVSARTIMRTLLEPPRG